MRKLIAASVLAVTMLAGLQAGPRAAHAMPPPFGPRAAHAMPPSCTQLGLELKFTFQLNIHHHVQEQQADNVHGHVTTLVGPVQQQGQDGCAPTSFHLRLALQYHKRTGWKTISTGAADEGVLPVGTIIVTHADRVCEKAWNGYRHWRLRLRWWGRTGINQFQRGRTLFGPNASPGKRMRCFSA